jgi:hypothetical protein
VCVCVCMRACALDAEHFFNFLNFLNVHLFGFWKVSVHSCHFIKNDIFVIYARACT